VGAAAPIAGITTADPTNPAATLPAPVAGLPDPTANIAPGDNTAAAPIAAPVAAPTPVDPQAFYNQYGYYPGG
jgi:hypothetical protein